MIGRNFKEYFMLVASIPMPSRLVANGDRVKTRSGRHGLVQKRMGIDTAIVAWDDGEVFPIKCCHLEIVARSSTPAFRTNETG